MGEFDSETKITPVGLTTAHRQLLETIATQNEFKSYQLSAIPGSAKGDNFLGLITSVTIKEGEKILKLMLKTAQVGGIRIHMPIHGAYLREIFIYENVFARFKEFQEEHGLSEPFRAYAKIYATSNEENSECLVLEDLRDSGFSMCDKKSPMNLDHLAAVVKEYAKFHAVSLAMRQQQPEVFDELTKNMRKGVFEDYFSDKEHARMFTKGVMRNVYEVFGDDSAIIELLQRFEESLPETFEKMAQQPEEVVIDHGDCWCNNLMFLYENPENPTEPSKVCIIDWQISKVGSPVMDLLYFLLVNSSKEMLYKYEDFLKLYHDTLSKNLREFSCDPEKILSYSTLLEYWNERVKFGIFTAFNIFKLTLCDSDEAPDFTKIDDGDNNIMKLMGFTAKDVRLYSQRIRDLVQFSIEKGYL